MPRVDESVLATLAHQIFAPHRLIDLVSGYLAQAKEAAKQQRTQLSQLKAEHTETEGAINRLLGMVERGLMEVDDPALRDRLSALKAKRGSLISQIASASENLAMPSRQLTEAKLAKLSAAVRDALHTAAPEMRKAYIKMFVDKVILSRDEIRISGPKGYWPKPR